MINVPKHKIGKTLLAFQKADSPSTNVFARRTPLGHGLLQWNKANLAPSSVGFQIWINLLKASGMWRWLLWHTHAIARMHVSDRFTTVDSIFLIDMHSQHSCILIHDKMLGVAKSLSAHMTLSPYMRVCERLVYGSHK